MRELTLDELDWISGGLQQTTGAPDDPGEGGGGGGPTVVDITMGAPVPWTDGVADLQTFFNDMNGSMDQYTRGGGSDQSSDYDHSADYSPIDGFFREDFGGYLSSTQYEALGGGFYNFLTAGVDPEFLLATYGTNSATFDYSGGQVRLTPLDGSDTSFNVNGLDIIGTWHQYGAGQSQPQGEPNDVIVQGSGGYFTFEYTGSPTLPSPQAPQASSTTSGPAVTTGVQAVADAEQHRVALDAQIHNILNQHDGHFYISFNGQDGVTSFFDLAEFASIFDNYHLTSTQNIDYSKISGGAGQVIKLSDGSYQTQIDEKQLIGYDHVLNGIDYLVLHEASHYLSVALSYRDSEMAQFYQQNSGATSIMYTGVTGKDGSTQKWMIESYVNNITNAIEDQLNVAHMANPGGGTNYGGHY